MGVFAAFAATAAYRVSESRPALHRGFSLPHIPFPYGLDSAVEAPSFSPSTNGRLLPAWPREVIYESGCLHRLRR